jgi:hypothetical protein
MNRRTPFHVLALVVALFVAGCTIQIVYRDGCFFVSGIPPKIKAVRVRLKTPSSRGVDMFVATHAVGEDGRSAQFCVGEAFRRTYASGEVELTTYDENGDKVEDHTNTDAVSVDGTGGAQEVPYGAFD